MNDNSPMDIETQQEVSYQYDEVLPAASLMLKELLKASDIQSLFESYFNFAKIPVAIIDLRANVLLSSRWQRICTQFHRVHPKTCNRCVECDTKLALCLDEGQCYTIYRCLNGLTECASPIVIDGHHIANLFIGQFLTNEPDEIRFRQQADEFGFNVDDYVAALRKVPVVDEKEVAHIIDLLVQTTRVITSLSVERRKAIDDKSRQFLILDTIPQPVYWKDIQGRYLGCNASFARVAGLESPDDVIGKTDYDLVWSKAEADAYRADDQAVIAENRPRKHIIEPALTADGTRIVIDTAKIPLVGVDGTLYGVLGISEDITEHKKAEKKLVEQTALLSLAGRVASFGGWSVDLSSNICLWSDEVAAIHEVEPGFSPPVEQGINFYAPEWREKIISVFGACATDGTPYDEEMEIITAKGNRRWVRTIGQPEWDSTGKMIRISGSFQDITDRKRDEKKRIELEEQLLASQKMEAIGSLAGGVAHDFNNLLSVILGYTGFAMEALREGDPLKDDLSEVKKASEKAESLTRQLLAFSRKQVLQPVVLNLNQIATGLEKMLGRILGEDVDLVQQLAPDLGLVTADPSQIEQVLMNLVVNARDAMPQGGTLTIKTSNIEIDEEYASRHVTVSPGAYIQLAVTDTGCGMDAHTKARLFEPFFTTKPKGKGTGLGLSTVYGIVKQSGGDIWVYSEQGHGTTFKIYLPRDLSDLPTERGELPAVVTPTSGAETILLVDDEGALREVARRSLVAAGYTVLTAEDGNDALRIAARYAAEIHLLLTDVVMPGMNGRTTAHELVKMRPTIKVVYMSGYTDDAIMHHGVIDVGTHFIAKPFTSAGLTQKIREVLATDLVGDMALYRQTLEDADTDI